MLFLVVAGQKGDETLEEDFGMGKGSRAGGRLSLDALAYLDQAGVQQVVQDVLLIISRPEDVSADFFHAAGKGFGIGIAQAEDGEIGLAEEKRVGLIGRSGR